MPFSTQRMSGVSRSNWSVAGPSLQWFIPGTKYKRTRLCALGLSVENHRAVSSAEKIGSLPP